VAGPVCRLGAERKLRVVVPESAREVDVLVGEARIGRLEKASPGARAIDVLVPVRARLLEVRASIGGQACAKQLPVEDEVTEPPWLDLARDARNRGQAEEVIRLLDGGERADERVAIAADGLAAKVALVRGEQETALRSLESVADRHAARGELSRAVDIEATRAWALIEAARFDEARAALERMRAWSVDYPEGRALTAYNLGLLAMNSGDLRESLASLSEARTRAERIAYDQVAHYATQSYANALVAIGRADEAYVVVDRLQTALPTATAACDRADLDTNLGWAALLARDAALSGSSALDPLPPLNAAVAAYRSTCVNAPFLGNALADRAWAELQIGRIDAARKTLAEARAASPKLGAMVQFFAMGLEAKIALAAGDIRAALRAYDRLASQSEGVSPLDYVSALDGRAEALAKRGDLTGAIEAAAGAEARLDEAARAVPIGEGRGAFWWARARVARRWISLLLDAGRTEEALKAARATHARIMADVQRAGRVDALSPDLRAKWERAVADYRRTHEAIVTEANDDWTLSVRSLAPTTAQRRARDVEARAGLDATARELFDTGAQPTGPLATGSGVVGVAWQPLERGWVAFVVRNDEVRAVRIPESAPSGDALLAAVARDVVSADRVRILPLGAARDVDFQALAIDGAPLVTRAVVEYVVDLPTPAADTRAGKALVVADPTESLPAARAEGRDVAAVFTPAVDTRLVTGSEATRARLIEELDAATLFHFAGHGSYAGVDGWESALVLAGDERLTTADVLALPHAPAVVVLSGCETGREGDRGGADGLGLGAAFLAAGSRAVLASVRAVPDAVTARLMRDLARALVEQPSDPARALQKAQVSLLASAPSVDWSAFRAFVR
jgi:tetratricopeptide (TPR) repeat protein